MRIISGEKMKTEEEAFEENDQGKTIRDRMEKEERERVDAQGVK